MQESLIIPHKSKARSWRNLKKGDYLLLFFFLFFVLFCYFRLSGSGSGVWNWARLLPYLIYENGDGTYSLGMLSMGFIMTIRLSIWAFVLALSFGLLIGSYSANKKGISVFPITIFVQTLRNIPPLVFIFLVYFFSGQFFSAIVRPLEDFAYSLSDTGLEVFSYIFAPPIQIESMTAAIIALGLYEGVYIAEIVRSSIESIAKTQSEASRSLGFNKFQTLYYIILPQAKKIMLPPLAGQTTAIIKGSSLAALVSLPELSFQSLEVMSVSRITYEVWIVCMLLYFFLSCICTAVYSILEKRIPW